MRNIITTPIVLVIFLVGLSCHLQPIFSAKILSVSFFASKSHKIVYEPILGELANRGHSLTVVTSLKGNAHKNIKDEVFEFQFNFPFRRNHRLSHKKIVGIGMREWSIKMKEEVNIFDKRIITPAKDSMNIFSKGHIWDWICRSYYSMPEVQALKNEHWDLILVNAIMNECTLGLVHHLKAPWIIVSTISPMPWTSAITGTPSPASFVPMSFLGYNNKMNFLERAGNLLGQMVKQAQYEFDYTPQMEKVYREFLGEDTPSLYEIKKNVSMIISTSHFSTEYARPLMPDIVEVGGLHCHPAKLLPKDLDDFLTASGKDGFIYFSMGSVVKPQDMPDKYRKMFVNAFSKVKQRVLWKWDTETMDDLSMNVKLSQWLPQQDVLGHPNIKMFITHGGLGSTVEAVYHGVPLIGIPMFGDQDSNMKQSESNGFALTLEFGDLTEESVLNAINTMLNEPKYTKRVKELSAIYRDRPRPPLDDAIYWMEYVIRHKGAVHLRSPARDLNWAQYHSVDVIAFVTALISIVIYLVFVTLRCICKKVCGSSRKKAAASKKKN